MHACDQIKFRYKLILYWQIFDDIEKYFHDFKLISNSTSTNPIGWTHINFAAKKPKAPTAMLSHPPPNRQSPASFDEVTRLPPKHASAPLGYPEAWWTDIPVPQVSPIDTCLHAKNHNDPCPATWWKAASPGGRFSAVAMLGGGWLQSPASDGPPWFSLLEIRLQRPWVQILHSAEEDNLSPVDSISLPCCQCIKINTNKYVFSEVQVSKVFCKVVING